VGLFRQLVQKLRTNELWRFSLLLMITARIGDVINMIISLFLVPEFMDPSEMGAILPLMRMINVIAVPITVTAAVFLRFSTKFEAAGQPEKTNKLLHDFWRISLVLGLILCVALVLLAHPLGTYYQVSDFRVIWVIGALGLLACCIPPLQTAIQVLERYRMFVWGNIAGPSLRLLFAILLIGPLQILGLFIANASAGVIRAVLIMRDAVPFILSRKDQQSYHGHLPDMMKFAIPFGVYTLLLTSQLFLEASVVRTALGEADSAGFFMITTLGSAPMYLLAALTPILLPILSHRHEKKIHSKQTHVLMLLCALGLGLCITFVLFLIGPHIFTWKESWKIFAEHGPFLWLLGFAYCLSAVDTIHRTNLHAQSNFRYLLYFVPLLFLEILLFTFLSFNPEFLVDKFGDSAFFAAICIMVGFRLPLVAGTAWDLLRTPGRQPSATRGAD